MKIKHLFTPVKIKNLEIKNRISMPAMHLNFTPKGEMTDQMIEFYARRAKGGVGLIIVGGISVSKYAAAQYMPQVSDDKFISGLSKLTKAIKDNGARAAIQLYHAGRYVHQAFLSGEKALSASAVPSRFTHETPKEMTHEEIDREIQAIADAARRSREAGFDVVEVIASAGYIISQFLSPITNIRTDEYGGSWENRMRFGLEVLDRVRKAVGDDYPVGMRIAGNDFMPGSNTNKESRLFAAELDKNGIDFINVTGGWHETRIPQITTFVPRGAYVYLARGIKNAVSVPVMASNRIVEPYQAEEIIANGIADIVNIGRGMIADPDWAIKAQTGRSDEIKRCIACSQGCLDHVFTLQQVGCLVNPEAGYEHKNRILDKTDNPKSVLVIGGGLAGMQAAVAAQQIGHNAVLVEKTDKLGGQFILASRSPGREELYSAVEDLERDLIRLNVKVMMSTTADEKLIDELKPDAIILATGAKPLTPPIKGVDNPIVVQAWDVLSGDEFVGDNVVVVGGGAVGVEVAYDLASIGTIDADTVKFLLTREAEDIEVIKDLAVNGIKNVTVVEMLPKLGRDIGKASRWTFLQDLNMLGIRHILNSKVTEITNEGVKIEVNGKDDFIPADTVVMAVGSKSNNELYEKINKEKYKVIIVGDAKKPRKAYEAIHEGYKAARNI